MRPAGRVWSGLARNAERGRDRVLALEVAERDGRRERLLARLARVVPRAVAGGAADLGVGVPPANDGLEVGPDLPRRAGARRGSGRGPRPSRRAPRVAGEQVRHGRARLDRLRVGEELLQVADAGPRTPTPSRIGACFFVRRRLVAADAVQFAEQKRPPAPDRCPARRGTARSPERRDLAHAGRGNRTAAPMPGRPSEWVRS